MLKAGAHHDLGGRNSLCCWELQGDKKQAQKRAWRCESCRSLWGKGASFSSSVQLTDMGPTCCIPSATVGTGDKIVTKHESHCFGETPVRIRGNGQWVRE